METGKELGVKGGVGEREGRRRKGRGGGQRRWGESRESPPGTQKILETHQGRGRDARPRLRRGGKFLRRPLPSSALPGPAGSRAPRGPGRPGACPPERGPMAGAGPAPSRADWLAQRRPRLINKFSGEQRPDPEPASAPGKSACAAAPAENQAPGAEPAFWGGAGGARARARPARAPGAARGRPRSSPPEAHARRLARAAAGGGPGSAWPRLLT